MQGCVQRVFFGDVNAATVRVLAAEGFEVHAPRAPRCCGSLQLHAGVEEEAIELAKATIAAYEGFEHVAVNVAGCGSGMKDYAHLLADDPAWAERATAFAAKVRDVSELLAELEPQAPRHPLPMRVAYHDACHLAHAQKVRAQPRALLNARSPGWSCTSPPSGSSAAARPASTTSSSPSAAASSARARPRTSRPPAPRPSPPATPAARSRSARTWTSRVFHPMTLLDHSIRGTRP